MTIKQEWAGKGAVRAYALLTKAEQRGCSLLALNGDVMARASKPSCDQEGKAERLMDTVPGITTPPMTVFVFFSFFFFYYVRETNSVLTVKRKLQ